jgi:hypothetical protein
MKQLRIQICICAVFIFWRGAGSVGLEGGAQSIGRFAYRAGFFFGSVAFFLSFPTGESHDD